MGSGASEKESLSSKRIKDLKLNLLLEVTKAINNNFSTEQLLDIFQNFVKDQLNIGKLLLFSNDSGWKCLLKYGVNEQEQTIDIEKDLIKVKEISTIDLYSKTPDNSFEIIIPVLHKSEPLAFLLIGDLEDKQEMSPAIKHLPFIQTLTNIIIVAIENKKLAKENIRQAAIKKELELASEMQSMLFPTKLPNNKYISMAAFYQPHTQVGGDYYDYIQLNENELVFCMADVSGKGVSAALLMSNFQANLRALLNNTISLTDLVRELNSKVMGSAKGEKFITFFIAKYNVITKVLTYVNAAHNPPILANGNSISLLKIGCTGLGMFDELEKVSEGIVNINTTSILHCYTDGLVELENEKGKEYGIDALKEIIKKNVKLNPAQLNKVIVEDVIRFKASKPYVDDIALLTCKIS